MPGKQVLQVRGVVSAATGDFSNSEICCLEQVADVIEAEIGNVCENRRAGYFSEPEIREPAGYVELSNDIVDVDCPKGVFLDEGDGPLHEHCGILPTDGGAALGNSVNGICYNNHTYAAEVPD